MKAMERTIVSGLLISSLFISPVSVFAVGAKETVKESPTATPTPAPIEVTTTTTVKTEYELPYPGILPNNPLYFLKRFRDWILEKLIVDPVKKAEFYLLQADKRLNMAILLAGSGAESLSNQAITQAETFMGQAVDMLTSIKNQGKEVPAYLVDRLEKSMVRHGEVLAGELARATTDARKAVIQAAIDALRALQEALAKLK